MTNIRTNALELIGNTPLMELMHLEKEYDLKARLLGKLEYLNATGSIKIPSSSNRHPAIPASVWHPSVRQKAIGSSSSCRKRSPSNAEN